VTVDPALAKRLLEASDAASLALAKRLGFRPVDTDVAMRPPGEARG